MKNKFRDYFLTLNKFSDISPQLTNLLESTDGWLDTVVEFLIKYMSHPVSGHDPENELPEDDDSLMDPEDFSEGEFNREEAEQKTDAEVDDDLKEQISNNYFK